MESNALRLLGLSSEEERIYLAALASGTSSVEALAKQAGLKRPTAYNYILSLAKDGWLEKIPVGKRSYWRATDPERLKDRLAHVAQIVEEELPKLVAHQTSAHGRPRITVLEGVGGLREIYKEIQLANSLCFWSHLDKIERFFPKEVEHIAKSIAINSIHTREIITNNPMSKRAVRSFGALAGKTYSVKMADNDEIQNDNVVYGNVVALFRMEENDLFVVRIEDAVIAQSMKAIFDLAWRSAKSI